TSVASSIVRPHLGSTTGVSFTPHLQIGPACLGDDDTPVRVREGVKRCNPPPTMPQPLSSGSAGLYPHATPRFPRGAPMLEREVVMEGSTVVEPVHGLARNALGLPQVLFCIVTGAAPIAAMLFNDFWAVYGGGWAAPSAFMIATFGFTILDRKS